MLRIPTRDGRCFTGQIPFLYSNQMCRGTERTKSTGTNVGKSPTESDPFLVPGEGKLRSLHQLPVTSTQWCTGGSFTEDKARHEVENSRPRRGQGSEKTASRQGNRLQDYITASTCCLTWLATGVCRTTWSTASTSVSGHVMRLFAGNV